MRSSHKKEREFAGMAKQKKVGKVILKGVGLLVLAIVLVVAVYAAYVVISYKRLPDNLTLEVSPGAGDGVLTSGQEYGITTYNIGFGAYTPEFSFFMDGGTSSVAASRESVEETVAGAAFYVKDTLQPDFLLWQEVDLDSTRSYHVNQYEMLQASYEGYDMTFAVNYDSAFLFYPLTQPHGKSRAGLAVMSSYPIESALRRSFPISTSFSKFLDLDRCYSINRIPVDNGKYLCIINLHMSAYGNSDEIRQGQVSMLCEDMRREYEAGNYVICGGDFNHDLKALTDDGGERESWAYPFPREELPEGFAFCMDALSDEERDAMHDSARNADEAYNPETTYTVTLDGFIISDNIECTRYENVDLQYLYSDHDPVYMRFILK